MAFTYFRRIFLALVRYLDYTYLCRTGYVTVKTAFHFRRSNPYYCRIMKLSLLV